MMLIRPFRADDADRLAALFHTSVHQVGIRDYSAEQISAWSPAVPDSTGYIRRSLDGRVFLVAVDDDDNPIGYGDLEANSRIDHLYCRPDVVGTGMGSALYDALEGAARHRGIQFLFVRQAKQHDVCSNAKVLQSSSETISPSMVLRFTIIGWSSRCVPSDDPHA